jgi:hypothetical protein
MTVAILVTEVPAATRAAVEFDARERTLSMNSVVVSALAERYGVAYESSGYPFKLAETGSDDWLVRMPEALRDAIKSHAHSLVAGSQRGCILLALAAHYGLPEESPRRRREQAIDPEVVRVARQRNRSGESLRSLAREYRVHRETLTRAVRA